MNKRKILLIGITPPPLNGQSIAFQALTNNLDAEILLISGQRNTNILISLTKIFNFFGLLFQLIRKLLFNKYVVYLTISQSIEGFLRDFIIVMISKFFNNKVILHIHGGNYDGFYRTQKPMNQKQINRMLTKADSILVLSKSLTKMFSFHSTLKNKIKIVPNGLPWDFDKSQTNHKILPKSNDSPIKIIFLSNLIESKGYLDVLEAVSILINEYGYPIQADFCGEFIHYTDAKRFATLTEAKEYFYAFIAKNNLENHINYHGIIGLGKKQKLLKEAHFFILPTNYINEGQPIAIIEAMAYSCVVLTTDYRGISELITNYKSGVYVKYNNPQEIAFEMHQLIENPTEFQRISINAYQNYLNYFTKEKHLENLIKDIESYSFAPKNAIDFHSETAIAFDQKYVQSAQFRQRYKVWTRLLDRYTKPGMTVLDAGCGSGIFSIYLAKKECIVLGIDGSDKMIELCKHYQRINNLKISFLQAVLPLESTENIDKKDVILCSSVLEYIADFEPVIKQFKKLLNPEGLLIISMPNKDSWYRKIEKYIFQITNKPSYYQYIQHILTEKEFSNRLKIHGFELQEITYYPNTTNFSRLLKCFGLKEINTNAMFLGVYKSQ